MFQSLFNLESDKYAFKTIFHASIMIFMILAVNQVATTIGNSSSSLVMIALLLTAQATIVILLTVLYVTKFLKMQLADFYLGKPNKLKIWVLCAILLPVGVSAFFILFVPGQFGMANESSSLATPIVRNIFGTALGAAVLEELVFRSILLKLLENRWNRYVAVLLPSILFAVLHVLGANAYGFLDYFLIIGTISVVAITLCMITFQSGSIWPAVAVHFFWNLIILSPLFSIGASGVMSKYYYLLDENSKLLTGGSFGIEGSLPTMFAFGILLFIAWSIKKKNDTTSYTELPPQS